MELQEMFVTLGLKAGEFNQGLDDAAKKAQSFGDRVKGGLGASVQAAGLAVTTGLAAAGGAIVALGASSVGVATDFQSAMAIMSTAVDPVSLGVESTAEAMAILSDASLAVGSDTALVGVSASTSAEAMTGLYKAGLTTGEIFGDLNGYLAGTAELGGALRASIDLAAASELDMVQASDLAAVTLATFGGELTTTEERAAFVESAMNNFVQTADASVASVGDLQAAFVNVGPTASALGMGVEDVNTALGLLSTRGITGSEAGTALKSMLTNLMQTTPDVTGTLEDLNVSLYDAQGVMYSLPEIIGQLEAGMAGMTEEQRNQTVTTLAGTYGMNAMNTLLGEGTAGWAAMEAAVGSAATMQETAAARTDTLAGAQEALAGVWETFQITVGTALIPVLTALADIGASLIEKYGPALTAVFETIGGVVGGFIANVQEGMSPLNAFIEAIRDIAPPELIATLVNFRDNILPGLITKFHEIVDPVIAAVTNFVSFKDVLIALGIVVAETLIPIIISLVTTMAPILLTVGAIIAVVALLRNAWENDWGGIQEKVQGVIDFIVPLVQNGIAAIQAWWATNGAAILAKAQAIFGGIQTTIQTVIGAVITWWNTNWPTIQATIETVWGLISSVIGAAIEVIRPAIETIITTAQGVGEKLGQLAGPLQELWAKIGPFVQAAATVIGGILTALVGVIVGIVNGIAKALDPLIRTFVNVAENVIQIIGGIIEFFTGFFNLLIGMVTDDGDRVKKAFGQMGSGIKDIITGLVEGVWNLFSGLVETVATLIDGFITGIIDFFQNLYDDIVGHSIIPDLVNDIVTWFGDLITWIGDTLLDLWTTVSQPFIDMWADLTAWFGEKVAEAITLGSNIVQGLIDGVKAMGGALTGALGDIVNGAINSIKALLGISSPSQLFHDIGVNIGAGLVEGILATTDDVTAAMEAIFDALGTVSGLGTGFAQAFTRQTLDPLQANIGELGEQIADYDKAIGAFLENLGLTGLDPGDTELMLRRYAASDFSTYEERYQAEAALSFMEERARLSREQVDLQNELAAGQERIAALEEKRAQMNFLQQQLDLIKLIQDNGLDTSILEGLTLGLDADPGALMDAMVESMRQMIAAAEEELGVHSPSRVFQAIGEQVQAGLIRGIGDSRDLIDTTRGVVAKMTDAVRASLGGAGAPSLNAVTPGSDRGTTYNVQNQTINGGQNFYLYDAEESELERLGVLAR